MTLLEVVLAVTILAAMSGLIASMWTQATRMADDGGGQHRAMRLARVLEMMRSQWADRRTSVKLGRGGSSVTVEPEAMTFITATAILEPGWPIVRARYVVERDYDTGTGALAAWRLVYEELPVVDLESPLDQPGDSEKALAPGERRAERPVESPKEKRLMLLAGCAELGWERFGKSDRAEVEEAERSAENEVSESNDPSTTFATRRNATAPAEERTSEWRPLVEGFRGKTPAVRLFGEFEGKEFACVFVIGDSR
jgi:type II secretory pathway pseudopilin PulG